MSYSPNPLVASTPEGNVLSAIDTTLETVFSDGVKITDRNLALNTSTVTVSVDLPSKTATFTSSRFYDWSGVQIGDYVLISAPPFSDVNAGFFKVTGIDVSFGLWVQVQRISGVPFSCKGESVTVSANSQVVAFSGVPPLQQYKTASSITNPCQSPVDLRDIVKGPFKLALIALCHNMSSLVENVTVVTDGSLSNGWLSYDGGSTYNQPGYFKDPFGIVYLQGLIRSGTISSTSSGNVFTLPAGYRPSKTLVISTGSYNGTSLVQGEVRILSTGEVRITGGSNSYVSLERISFRAFQ